MDEQGEVDLVSRGARVKHPSFLEGLEDLPLEEIRHRRDQALAEREFQSYLRRLIQVREDLLVAERTRRESGAEPAPLLDRLRSVLAEGPQGRGRGEALRLELPGEDMAEADRRADSTLGGAAMRAPEQLEESELDDALERLAREERVVSLDRAAVIKVHDRLQEELKRRFREDPMQALEAP